MSDDLVNQITLNFLISKQQLQKLNKKIKQKEEDKMKTDMEIYKDQVVDLFFKMINDELPDDLLEDVKHSYTYFVDKSIYYLKMKESSNTEFIEADKEDDDATVASSSETEEEDDATVASSSETEEDDATVASSSETEEDEDATVASSSETEEDDEDTKLSNTNKGSIFETQIEPKMETRYKKFANTKSKGVDDIQHLPLDWFSKVRQTYKQNQIIPRHKDKKNDNEKDVVIESPTNYKNTEKKNINRLYEDKTNDKNKKTKE